MKHRYQVFAMATVFLAFALRLYRFDELPPGLFFDEAFNVLDGLAVWQNGLHTVFFPGNNGREAFYIYFQSLFVLPGSTAPFAVRLPSVFLGTATVALTFVLTRRLLAGQPRDRALLAAVLASFFLATLQWHLGLSRVGFRAIAQPFFEALGLYLLLRGFQVLSEAKTQATRARRTLPVWPLLLASGVAFGLGLYTYLAARLLPFALAVALGLVAWNCRLPRGRVLVGVASVAGPFFITIAPLAVYFLQHGDQFAGHSQDVSLLNFGGLSALVENALRLVGMFNFSGDVNWRHNLPGRPVFDTLSGLFFVLGAFLVLNRLLKGRQHAERSYVLHCLPPVFIAIMLLPSLLSEGAPHFLRGIGALPFVSFFPALGVEALYHRLKAAVIRGTASSLRKPLPAIAIVVPLAFCLAATVKGYFVDWGGRPDPYYHFDGPYLEFAAAIKAQGPQTRVFLSPWLANHATARLFLREVKYGSFDDGRTLVLPAQPALYAFQEGGVDRKASASFSDKLPARPQEVHLRDRYGAPAFGFFYLLPSSTPTNQAPSGLSLPYGRQDRITFADQVELLGVTSDSPELVPGSHFGVSLAWRPLGPIHDDYTVSLRLLDRAGRIRAQRDTLVAGPHYATSRWQQGDVVIDRLDLSLPADLPPGEYELAGAAYSLARRSTLEVRIGTQPSSHVLSLGRLKVIAPAPDALDALSPQLRSNQQLGFGITLVGFGFERQSVKLGEAFDVDLYWQATQDVARDLEIEVALVDNLGQIVGRHVGIPADGGYPTVKWRAGDGLRDTHRVPLMASAAAGSSTVHVALREPGSSTHLSETSLAGPNITERQHSFSPPKAQFPRLERLGDRVELLGFDLTEAKVSVDANSPELLIARRSVPLGLVLFWRALSQMGTSYTVFVQLIDSNGRLAAQHDGLPQEGMAPTSGWLSQEVISDNHVVSSDLPAGDYVLIVGLYNAVTGKRLPVGSSDSVKLATVRIEAP